MRSAILRRIRQAVCEQRHRISKHAAVELRLDYLHAIDAECAILTGRIVRVEKDAPERPGPCYTVVGKAADLTTRVGVVCRFEPAEQLLIITAYEVEP